jgi:hypothetical protein
MPLGFEPKQPMRQVILFDGIGFIAVVRQSQTFLPCTVSKSIPTSQDFQHRFPDEGEIF